MESSVKQIVYKGKTKEIPVCNSDPKLCEFYIIAKMRYCKFEKHEGNQLCIYHRPNTEDNVLFVDCPIDKSHRVLASKLKKHVKVCNKLGEKERLISNVWYNEKINKVKENEERIKNENLAQLYDLKWEELTEEEYSNTLDKIMQCYQILRDDYKKYSELEDLQEILNKKNLNNENGNDYKYELSLSGLEINLDKDLLCTKDLAKSEKNGKQNQAIGNTIKNFGLLDNRSIYIEFGAGKGGLSHHINTMTKDNSVHVLLEREGVRYKRDKYSENLIRFRTDILDFNINYIDDYFKEKKAKILSDTDYNLIGVAKHICGCAFDLSLTCLLNYNERKKVKAVAMATCCHHICTVEHLNNLGFYLDYLKLSVRETILLFKATSWIFGPIDIKNEDVCQVKSTKIFKQKGVKKNYIGLISKYVVDLARVFFLVSKNFKVFYLKYCDNEITTENNMILAIQ